MDQQNEDLMKWTSYFKGNYRKGVNKLEVILDTPTLYSAMKQDFLPLTVLLSGIDGQSGYLAKAIQDRGLANELVEAYATLVHGGMSEFLAIEAEKLALMSASYLSADAMEAVLASEAAVSAMIGDEKAIGLAAFSSTARDAILADSSAMAKITASESKGAKFAAGCAGLNPGKYSTYAGLMGTRDDVLALAESAHALNMICKNELARTAWMAGGYAHAFYDVVYDTLHNAPNSLFSKHETYYEKTAELTDVTYAGLYSNAQGGWSGNGSSSLSHATSVPFEGITLLNRGAAYWGDDDPNEFGSSQTKETIMSVGGSSSSLVEMDLVCVGGASEYSTVGTSNNSQRGWCYVQYATYAAV